MKNIHVIPTDKPSRLAYDFYEKFYLLSEDTQFFEFQNLVQNRELYITSDEEIKEGDWGYRDSGIVFKMTKELLEYYISIKDKDTHKRYKIILTTDQDLIKDGVQAIPEYFLKWFIEKANDNGKAIDIIETKSHLDSNYFDNGKINYQIIIPKEEPKMIECYFTPSSTTSSATKCVNCGEEKFLHNIGEGVKILNYIDIPKEEQKKPFYCSDRLELDENERCITQCDHCAPKEKLLVQNLIDMMKDDEELGLYDVFNDEKRQGVKELIDKHTLEEAAEKWFNKDGFYPDSKQGFISGAKWQAKRMHSEEEVLEIIRQYALEEHLITSSKPDIWFEQFKKK